MLLSFYQKKSKKAGILVDAGNTFGFIATFWKRWPISLVSTTPSWIFSHISSRYDATGIVVKLDLRCLLIACLIVLHSFSSLIQFVRELLFFHLFEWWTFMLCFWFSASDCKTSCYIRIGSGYTLFAASSQNCIKGSDIWFLTPFFHDMQYCLFSIWHVWKNSFVQKVRKLFFWGLLLVGGTTLLELCTLFSSGVYTEM